MFLNYQLQKKRGTSSKSVETKGKANSSILNKSVLDKSTKEVKL